MSNSAYFLKDICRLNIGDMECLEMPKTEEILEPQDENQKNEKLKESHLLLKKKLSLSHELIKQYNDKIKECQEVATELETAKESLKKITQKHNSSLSKIVKLEIENEEYRQKVSSLSKILPEKETKIAANEQHLRQLKCRMKELENGRSNEVETLQTELKAVKDSHKTEIKELEMKLKVMKADAIKGQTRSKEVKSNVDKSTCTGNELEPVKLRHSTREQSTLTNDFYSIKDDPYPLFCSKCEVKLDPVPLDQILKQMSSCPKLITEVPSPSRRSGNVIRDYRDVEFTRPEAANNVTRDLDPAVINSSITKSDFERLEQKISLLERKLRKKSKLETIRSHNPCCGYQYPNNCYMGPYQNLFHPGAMMGPPQPPLNQFQNWQEGIMSQTRSRKLSIRRSISRGSSNKSRKRRKLDDGTSEWNVDHLPSRDHSHFDNDFGSETADFEPINERLRSESPPFSFSKLNNKPFKRTKEHKEASPCPSPRIRKRVRASALISPLRSPSPMSYDEEIPRRLIAVVRSPEVSSVQSEPIDEEIGENCNQTPDNSPEYEVLEIVPRKRGRPRKDAPKPTQKESLVKKIRNLKKNCNKIIQPAASTPVPVVNNSKKLSSGETAPANNVGLIHPLNNDEVSNRSSDYCCPPKKQRIAHSVCKPKNDSVGGTNGRNSLLESEEFDLQKDHSVTQEAEKETVERIEKLIESVEKNEIIVPVEDLKSGIILKNQSKNPEDTKRSLIAKRIAAKYAELKSPTDILSRRIAAQKILNGNSIGSANPSNEVLNSHEEPVAPLEPCVTIPSVYLDVKDPGDLTINDKETEEISNVDSSLMMLRSKSREARTSLSEASLNNGESVSDNEMPEVSGIRDTSMAVQFDKSEDTNTEVLDNERTCPAVTTRKYKKRVKVAASPISPMRELRSRRIMPSPSTNPEDKNSVKCDDDEDDSSSKNLQIFENVDIRGFGPKALLNQHFVKRSISESKSRNKKRFNVKLQNRKENLVINELRKLAEDPDWKTEVLFEVIEKLSKFKTHTIAKCIIDFLAKNAEDDEDLDRTHTPPAPLLRKTQQRVLTMLVTLNRTVMPDIIELVQAGIEYRLLALGYAPEVNVVEELTRVFAALARIKKDRERVRILCCDALYCLGLKAMPLIYVILTSWPESLPMAGSSDPLLLCVTDVIMKQQSETTYRKLPALKQLLSGYYKYESDGLIDSTFVTHLMTTLREKRQNGLDTAIILLAKKRGPDWTYKNIIQGGLLQMIIQKAHPSIYDAFCLLGHLMRSFPTDDEKGLVNNILEQLVALMESGEGSIQQQEGVATALLSLIRHKGMLVTTAIINWEPSEPISESTRRRLTALFDNYTVTFWQKLLHKKHKKQSLTN